MVCVCVCVCVYMHVSVGVCTTHWSSLNQHEDEDSVLKVIQSELKTDKKTKS